MISSMNGQAFESQGLTGASHGTCAIGVMAKTPRPGFSKTRLCPPLRPEQAAALSAAFLHDTTTNIAQAGLAVPVTGYAAYAPFGTEEALISHVAQGTVCVLADGSVMMPQGVDGFGRCLLHALQQMFAAGHTAACVLSSDTPTLPTRFLESAVRSLLAGSDRRVVLGACDDGGYYLLGMRVPHARLFADIAWSTSSVAATTRIRAAELGLELVELPPWYDIDNAAALEQLVREDAGYNAASTRHTIRLLGLETFTLAQNTL